MMYIGSETTSILHTFTNVRPALLRPQKLSKPTYHWIDNMTLNTRIYIITPTAVRPVFDRVNELLPVGKGNVWNDSQNRYDPGDVWHLSNEIGQGWPGIVDIAYKKDGPYRESDMCYCEESEDWDDHGEDCYRQPACAFEISIDTGYGYSGPEGGCTDLHARIIVQLGDWLDGQGIDWYWQNEYTGDINHKYDGLAEFLGDGDEAREWFTNMMQPIIDKFGER